MQDPFAVDPSEPADAVAGVGPSDAVEVVAEDGIPVDGMEVVVDEVVLGDGTVVEEIAVEEIVVDEIGVAGFLPVDESDVAEGPADDAAVLDALEADLVAVEEAMASLDRIAADTSGGSGAAAQIMAVVSAERFPVDADTVDLT